MSKVDAMRVLKQARLEQQRRAVRAVLSSRAGAVPGAVPAAGPAATAAPATAAPAGSTAPPPAAATRASCGHRNMGGRSCTRDSGHSEKSHRYG